MDVDGVFMKSIDQTQFKPLSVAEQRRLIALAQSGDDNARNRLADSMIYYVAKIAAHCTRHSNVPYLDAIQAGSLGVLRAIAKFDLDRGIRFSTYATYWIRSFIQRECMSHRVVHVPCVAQHRGVEITEHQFPDCCDKFVESSYEEEFLVVDSDDVDALKQAIRKLPRRQRSVIRHRMNGKTLSQIGRAMKISKERVRQIQMDAQRALAANLESLREIYQ